MKEKHVEVERRGPVLIIRFVNPRKRNSMTAEFRSQLGEAIQAAGKNARVKVIYMTGSGPAFCSGGDLQMLKNGCDPWAVHRRFRELGKWFVPLMHFDKPVVVGVNGAVVGGGIGLALTGDIIVAAESAKFVPGFFRLGVIPDVGTMYNLPRLIGLARAKQFLFAGETWSAQDALQMGLVSKVVADADLEQECLTRAQALAAGPASIMGLSKLLMLRTFETGLGEMFLLEGLGQALSMSSDEFRERLDAMLNYGAAKPKRFDSAKAKSRASNAAPVRALRS